MTTAAKLPSFFKVFLPEHGSKRLQIPNAFVALTRLGERVPREFILRNGRGRDWKVKTSCIGQRVFFEDGWERFVEQNALQHADFIVFQYDGSNLFKFKIYELSSCCEKPEVDEEEVEHEEEINDGVMSMEIQEKEELKNEEEEGDNCVMEEDEDEGDDDDDDNDYEEDDEGDDEEDEDDADADADDNDDDDEEEEEEEEEHTVIDHARAGKAFFISKKGTAGSSGSKADDLNEYGSIAAKHLSHLDNPYFIAKQVKDRNNELQIPNNIIKDFSLSMPETLTLRCQYITVSSQEMTVRKNRFPDTGKIRTWKDGRVFIIGWSSFCRKNRIEANDTCICEMVLREDLKVEMLQVHVVRRQL